MTPTPAEVVIVNLVWFGLWDVVVLLLAVFGKRPARLAAFRQRALVQWRPALALAALALLGLVARDLSRVATVAWPTALIGDLLMPTAVFAQALVGFAIARSIPKFDPLPPSTAVQRRTHAVRTLVLTAVVVVIAAPLGLLLGSVGTSLGASVARETVQNSTVTSSFPANPVVAFLMLLAGAGIAEEVVYRLIILSLVWRLTHRAWVAVVVAAIVHGFYHLTPLDSFYQQFWHYPVAQVVGTIGISVVWGVVYVKRGLEAAIAGHTLSDWISVMILLR